jgi:thioredoxin-related protein
MATKLSILPSLAALALFVLASVSGANAAEQGKLTGAKMSTHPDWFKESFLEIADDVDEASEAGKHVLLFMEMNGCPYCFKMIEENFKDASYKAFIQHNFDVIALNIKGDREVTLNTETSATEKEIAETLGVTYTPTLIFLNNDNKPVARVNGYRNVDDF